MAHADYDCCAICDSKMNYSSDAATKERLCAHCAVEMSSLTGKKIASVKALLDWMRSGETEIVAKLKKVGFTRCYYANDVDDEAMKLDSELGKRP